MLVRLLLAYAAVRTVMIKAFDITPIIKLKITDKQLNQRNEGKYKPQQRRAKWHKLWNDKKAD